jgi:uncharacterized repeat protein (TIGR03803 family)
MRRMVSSLLAVTGLAIVAVAPGQSRAANLMALVSFCTLAKCANGANPGSGVIADAKGNLFGTTPFGGANGRGTVFEIVKTAQGYASTPTILYSFKGSPWIQAISAIGLRAVRQERFGVGRWPGNTAVSMPQPQPLVIAACGAPRSVPEARAPRRAPRLRCPLEPFVGQHFGHSTPWIEGARRPGGASPLIKE